MRELVEHMVKAMVQEATSVVVTESEEDVLEIQVSAGDRGFVSENLPKIRDMISAAARQTRTYQVKVLQAVVSWRAAPRGLLVLVRLSRLLRPRFPVALSQLPCCQRPVREAIL